MKVCLKRLPIRITEAPISNNSDTTSCFPYWRDFHYNFELVFSLSVGHVRNLLGSCGLPDGCLQLAAEDSPKNPMIPQTVSQCVKQTGREAKRSPPPGA
jgi:hypothetical protein